MKKIYLSKTDKKIFGVAGGFAEYFETDSTLIRLLFVLITLATGFVPGILTYIIAAFIIPKKPA